MLTKNEKQKIWRKANPEKLREYKRRNYYKNKDIVLAEKKRYYSLHRIACLNRSKLHREANREKYIWMDARKRAKLNNIPFLIEIKDIIIPEFCPLLGVKIKTESGVGQQDNSPALDRIDNALGYIPGNIKIISHLANRMKNSASKKELLIFSQNINKYLDHQ